METKKIRIKLLFAWYDLWIGFFIDKIKAKLYIFPIPCVGVVVSVLPEGYTIKKTKTHWSPSVITSGGHLDTYILYQHNSQHGAFLSYKEAVNHAHKLNKAIQ